MSLCEQRLLDIETCRMAALLGLPAARDASQVLAQPIRSANRAHGRSAARRC